MIETLELRHGQSKLKMHSPPIYFILPPAHKQENWEWRLWLVHNTLCLSFMVTLLPCSSVASLLQDAVHSKLVLRGRSTDSSFSQLP